MPQVALATAGLLFVCFSSTVHATACTVMPLVCKERCVATLCISLVKYPLLCCTVQLGEVPYPSGPGYFKLAPSPTTQAVDPEAGRLNLTPDGTLPRKVGADDGCCLFRMSLVDPLYFQLSRTVTT
jgi:hypothetical protein